MEATFNDLGGHLYYLLEIIRTSKSYSISGKNLRLYNSSIHSFV